METKQVKCHITNNSYSLTCIKSEGKNKWWVLDDITQLPIKRAQVMMSRANLAEVGLDEAFIKTCMKKINEYAEQGNTGAVKVLTDAFMNRSELGYNTKQLMNCAIVSIFLNDEDVLSYSPSQDKKKFALLENDEDLYAFFLNWAFDMSMKYLTRWHKSEETLSVSRAKEQILERHLSSTIERNKL
jgi:hypothetical protein